MIKLTSPNGKPVEIDPKAIADMHPNDGDYDARAKTILRILDQHHAVIETMEEIDLLIMERRWPRSNS